MRETNILKRTVNMRRWEKDEFWSRDLAILLFNIDVNWLFWAVTYRMLNKDNRDNKYTSFLHILCKEVQERPAWHKVLLLWNSEYFHHGLDIKLMFHMVHSKPYQLLTLLVLLQQWKNKTMKIQIPGSSKIGMKREGFISLNTVIFTLSNAKNRFRGYYIR